jgi:hypothetical protein
MDKVQNVPNIATQIFEKISPAILPDSPVVMAMAMLFGESGKLTH